MGADFLERCTQYSNLSYIYRIYVFERYYRVPYSYQFSEQIRNLIRYYYNLTKQ